MTMSFAKHILNTVFLGFPPLTKKNKKETEYEDFFCFDHIIRALYEEKKQILCHLVGCLIIFISTKPFFAPDFLISSPSSSRRSSSSFSMCLTAVF